MEFIDQLETQWTAEAIASSDPKAAYHAARERDLAQYASRVDVSRSLFAPAHWVQGYKFPDGSVARSDAGWLLPAAVVDAASKSGE